MNRDMPGADVRKLATETPSAAELGAMTLDEWRAYLMAEWTRRGVTPPEGAPVMPDSTDQAARLP